MSLYPYYRTLLPPTGVDHAAFANLIPGAGSCLVVVRATALQVFAIRGLGKLDLQYESRLSGLPSDMTVAPGHSRAASDRILLAFPDAKLSVLEWDQDAHDLTTLSLHYYQRKEFKKEFYESTSPPDVRVDPNGRCAALRFYGSSLAILPLLPADDAPPRDISEGERHWPFPPSFVIDVADTLDPAMSRIVDIVFLPDYHEPTLAILYESSPTWTGRLYASRDTCSLIVISLDLSLHLYPILYRTTRLPYNAMSLIPCPRPTPGLCILTPDALIHVDQGSPGVARAVNGYAASTTSFPFRAGGASEAMSLALEGSTAAFLSPDTLIVSVQQDGLLLAVELVQDGRSVVDLRIGRVGSSVVCSAIASSPLSSDNGSLLFLGSRAGDSLLIHHKGDDAKSSDHTENPSYNLARPVGLDEDADLYGDTGGSRLDDDTEDKGTLVGTYDFRVADTLTGIGCILDMAPGKAAPEGAEDDANTSLDPGLELVTATGYGQQGSLCILQQRIRPVEVSAFPIAPIRDIWTAGKRVLSDGVTHPYDRYILWSASGADTTTVLDAGEELSELAASAFTTDQHTLAVGDLSDCVAQVTPRGIRVVRPDASLATHVEFSQKAFHAIVQDGWVIVQWEGDSGTGNDGAITLWQWISATSTLKRLHTPLDPAIHALTGADYSISAFAIFSDPTAAFPRQDDPRSRLYASATATAREDLVNGADSMDWEPSSKAAAQPTEQDEDEIDRGLYGSDSDDDDTPATSASKLNRMDTDSYPIDEATLKGHSNTWLFLALSTGSLLILSLPDCTLVFASPAQSLLQGAPLLIDTHPTQGDNSITAPLPEQSAASTSPSTDRIANFVVMDMHCVGRPGPPSPCLFLTTEHGSVHIYRTFIHFSPRTPHTANRLAIRLRRWYDPQHDFLPSPDRSHTISRRLFPVPRLSTSDYPALLIASQGDLSPPIWVIGTKEGALRLHPMAPSLESPAPLLSLAPFHNENCPDGFLFYDAGGQLRLGQLPAMNYELPWLSRRIPIRQSPHKISYHIKAQKYLVVTSTPTPFRVKDDDGNILSTLGTNEFPPTTSLYSLKLYSSTTWEVVDEYTFLPNEKVLSMEYVLLESGQSSTRRKPYIAVGTAIIAGEEVAVDGNIYMFAVIDIVPEEGKPQHNHRLKMLCKEEVRGAVSIVAECHGNLLTSVNRQVIMRCFEDDERLTGVAFLDTQQYATSVTTAKNMALIGDIRKSVWFIAFQEEPPKLGLLGKDMSMMEVVATNFMLDGKNLSFVVADADANLHIFTYSPYNIQSALGQKLVRRADIHLGTQAQTILRLPTATYGEKGTRHCSLIGTLDGSIEVVMPTGEKSSKRLQLLAGRMMMWIEEVAGLNPKEFRLISHKLRLGQNAVRNVVDGDYVDGFLGLSAGEQMEVAWSIGTTAERILQDLHEVSRAVVLF